MTTFRCSAATACAVATLCLVPTGALSQTRLDSLVVLEGPAHLARGETVDSVLVLEGPTRIDGTAHGDVVALRGDVDVAGTILGTVVALSGEVRLAPGARVDGEVLGAEQVRGATSGAEVGAAAAAGASALGSLLASHFLVWMILTAAILVVGILLAWLAPARAAEAVYRAARDEPASAFLAGLLLAVTMPLLSLLLIVSIVGFPSGVALTVTTVGVAFAGCAVTAWVLGRGIGEVLRLGHWPRPARLMLGIAIFALATLVPVLGLIVWLSAAVFGAGASAVALRHWRERRPPEPIARPAPEPIEGVAGATA